MVEEGEGEGIDRIRGEVPALAGEQGYVDLLVLGNLAQSLSEVIVALLVESIELLLIVDGDDG